MNKGRVITVAAILLLWGVTLVITVKYKTKLSYLEWQYENEFSDDSIEIKNNGDYIEQSFSSPYEIINAISVKVGTFSRDNNSIWNIALISDENGEVLYNKDYNASLIVNNLFHTFKFDKNIKVDKSKIYRIRISAKAVNENTGIAYFVGPSSGLPGVISNGADFTKSLCFAVYGGDSNYWWIGYVLLIAILLSAMILRGSGVYLKGKNPLDDTAFGSMVIAFLVLILLNSFSVSGIFTDEFDNIRGGMIISNGGVLYRDYVTQHTPVMYYLCAVFSLLGAASLQQFRLSYYLFEAIIWGLLFARHGKHIGKKKMLLLTVFECVLIASLLDSSYGTMILSDGMQGLCITILLLEFLRFYKDRTIGWDKSIIISLSTWGCFGSAFISAYAIVFVVIAFVCLEISRIVKNKISFVELTKRYYKLLLSMVIPFITAVFYFKINHSLWYAYDQFYLFNREVYSQYNSLGDDLLEPFTTAGYYYFDILLEKINAILTAEASNTDILQLIVFLLSMAVLVTMIMKKRYVECVVLFCAMVFSATRGYGFHGLAAWYIAIMIIALFGDELLSLCKKRIAIPSIVLISIILVSTYGKSMCANLWYKQKPVSEIESRVVSMTKEGEGILIDTYCCDSIYFLYKNRYPINRVCYMLPWYMDWYEQDVVNDLNNVKPRVVVYNPDQEVVGYSYYTNSFCTELRKNYTQVSEEPNDGWNYYLWTKKDNND